MNKSLLSYSEPFAKLWDKATEKQKQELFYYSLFDFESFEEDKTRISLFNKIKSFQDKLISLIKIIDNKFFRKIKRTDFIKLAGNDGLLKFIFIHEFKEKRLEVKSYGNNFPDLIINDSIHFEIKRQVSTGNMGKDFWGVDLKNCKNLFLLILFPLLEEDSLERVKDLTNGYYFIKNYLAKKRDSDLLICYPNKENFKEILEKIIKCLNSPKWCKNE